METGNGNFCTELEETAKDIPQNINDSNLLDGAATSNENSDANNSWEHQLAILKQEIEGLQETYDESFLEIGRLLIQAKNVYKGRGSWIKWLAKNVPFSVRHAQRLIRVAEMFDDATLVSRLGLTSSKAYILTRIGKNDIDHFLGTLFCVGDNFKTVKGMTKRELELQVTIFLREKLASADHEGVTSTQSGKTSGKRVASDFEKLKKALNRAIVSIKGSDSEVRNSWISELEELCKTGLEELMPKSE